MSKTTKTTTGEPTPATLSAAEALQIVRARLVQTRDRIQQLDERVKEAEAQIEQIATAARDAAQEAAAQQAEAARYKDWIDAATARRIAFAGTVLEQSTACEVASLEVAQAAAQAKASDAEQLAAAARELQHRETARLRTTIAEAQAEAAQLRTLIPHLEAEVAKHHSAQGEELLAQIRADVAAAVERTAAAEAVLAEAKAAEAAVREQVAQRLAGYGPQLEAARPLMPSRSTPALALSEAYFAFIERMAPFAGMGSMPSAEGRPVSEVIGTLTAQMLTSMLTTPGGASVLAMHRNVARNAVERAKRDASR